ncbi:MAG TPA: hypothetical protein VEU62_13910 [Bryobacterales bacterium]|nr:hypothetical protein [Bryobacterales bacterium]
MSHLMSNTWVRTRWPRWQAKLWRLARLGSDRRGQDLVEYALLAGFVAVAAGALLPAISTSISTIFSRLSSVVTAAAS